MDEKLGFYWVCYGDDQDLTIAENTEQGWFMIGMEEPIEKPHIEVIEFISAARLRN